MKRVAQSRRAWRVPAAIAVAGLVSLAPMVILFALDVPLGETAHFVYRYSEIVPPKLIAAGTVIAALAPVIIAAWLLANDRLRPIGYVVACMSIAVLVAWNVWVPPGQVIQHAFNFRSPSHDGAFVEQAEEPMPIVQYLQTFDQRVKLSKERMRGTRVIANPPGMTVLFRALFVAWPADENGFIIRTWAFDPLLTADAKMLFDHAMKAALLCGLLLALAGMTAIGLGREFLSPVGAFVFAIVVTFNPLTVHFNPGKDPSQLLTVNLMLWAWFAGYRRRLYLLHAIAGAVLVIGMGFGVIHFWIALAALVATMWHEVGWALPTTDGKRWAVPTLHFFVQSVLPTCVGGAAVWLLIWATTGWNQLATLIAVSARWKELQPELGYDRKLWLMIGLPIVLVFGFPGVWLAATSVVRWRRWPRSFGAKLAWATAGAMALTYVIGIPYELPRLWVAFVPPLVLGLMATQPTMRGRSTHRVLTLLVCVVVVHVLATAVHWAMLDARESEYRIRSTRLFE